MTLALWALTVSQASDYTVASLISSIIHLRKFFFFFLSLLQGHSILKLCRLATYVAGDSSCGYTTVGFILTISSYAPFNFQTLMFMIQ